MSSKGNILVSVIIPVYNSEKYLEECLESAINQSLKKIEIICIDDASTDKSSQIISKYMELDSRIKGVFYYENKSASQARKDGVFSAEGKYIMFLDSDDTLELNACEKMYEKMEETDTDIIHFGTFVEPVDGMQTKTICSFEKFVAPYEGELFGEDVFLTCFKDKKYGFNIWNKIYKSSLCKKAFSFCEDGNIPKAQDLYAYFIISLLAKSYIGVPDKCYHYKYGRGITGGANYISIKDFTRINSQANIVNKCKRFLDEIGLSDKYDNILKKIEQSLLGEAVSRWFKNICFCDGKKGYQILTEYWGKKKVDEYLYEKYKDKYEYVKCKFEYGEAQNEGESRVRILNKPNVNIAQDYKKIIPIVLATNNNYAPYAGVTIESIIENTSPDNFYAIYVFYYELNAQYINLLESNITNNVTVECVDVSEIIDKKNVELHERAHFTKEMYFRFIIPDIFYFYEKVIYLDCDLIVERDLAELYEESIDSNYVGAIKNICYDVTKERLHRYFGIKGDDYFNSGVLVFNISKCLEIDLCKKCFQLLDNIPISKLLYYDQDILNIICNGNVMFFDERWNYCWNMIYGDSKYISLCEHIVENIKNDFYILHYASALKPWSQPQLKLSKPFWVYARQTPFYDEIIDKMYVSGEDSIKEIENLKNEINKLNTKINNLNKEIKKSRKKVSKIKQSNSYRVGRLITYIPRKVKQVIKYYKKNGLKKTINRIFIKLHLKKEIKKDYKYYSNLPYKKYRSELKLWYKKNTGEQLNLKNPKTFNEKIQWLKLYDSTPIKTKLTDKYEVRKWIEEKIGKEYLIPILGVWDSVEDINFNELPEKFVLKATHGSGWNIIVRNKSEIDINKIKEKLEDWLNTNYAFKGFELHYYNIKPRIIAEKYLENNNDNLSDYKIFCFDGKAHCIMFASDRSNGVKANFYDLKWNQLPYSYYPKFEKEIPKPNKLEEMIAIAEKLALGFAHVRVDFYILNDGSLKFGEMTFTNFNGCAKWEPKKYDEKLGNCIKLPRDKYKISNLK